LLPEKVSPRLAEGMVQKNCPSHYQKLEENKMQIKIDDGVTLKVSQEKINKIVSEYFNLKVSEKKRTMSETHRKAIRKALKKRWGELKDEKRKVGRPRKYRKKAMDWDTKKQKYTYKGQQIVFTPKEVNFIIKNFGKMKRKEIAEKIGKKPRQISDKVTCLRNRGVKIKRIYRKRKL